MRTALWAALWSALTALVGACGSSLVGLECQSDRELCQGACVDLSQDDQHCGMCGNPCASGLACMAGECRGGMVSDAGNPGSDSAVADAAPQDAGTTDGPVRDPIPLPPPKRPRCDGRQAADECSCEVGELQCGNVCVLGNQDPENCGQCGNECMEGAFCVGGECRETCEEPLQRCGGLCADLAQDFLNCGSCGTACPTGLCAEGQCTGALEGHAVLIGHDFDSSVRAQRKLPGNAVTLNTFRPRILGVTLHSSLELVNKINQTLNIPGVDPSKITMAQPRQLGVQLALHDVLLVYPQINASQSSLLRDVVEPMQDLLLSFLGRGGVVVVFEGSGGNDGTFQVLSTGGLMEEITGRERLALGESVKPDGAWDPAAAVATPYRVEERTFGFLGIDEDDVGVALVHDSRRLPILVHRVFR